jgi:hypothetical protein
MPKNKKSYTKAQSWLPIVERIITLPLGPGFSASSVEARFLRMGPAVGVVVPDGLSYVGPEPRLSKLGRSFASPGWIVLHVTRGDTDLAESEVRALVGSPQVAA